MKTLKILVCSLFVLCSAFFFAGCGTEPIETIDFDASKIEIIAIEANDQIYDGNPKAFGVVYPNEDVYVTYSTTIDGEFLPIQRLSTKNAGIHNLYYRISAYGYNDYTSPEPVSFEILKKQASISISDHIWIRSTYFAAEPIVPSYTIVGQVGDEDLGVMFTFLTEGNVVTLNNETEYNSVYNIQYTYTNTNYDLVLDVDYNADPKLTVEDKLFIERSSTKSFYPDLQSAIDDLQSEDMSIKLNRDISLNQSVYIDRDISIESVENKHYSIVANSTFDTTSEKHNEKTVASMFIINTENVTLNLKNLTLNCAFDDKGIRGVTIFNGNLLAENVTILGLDVDDFDGAGIYLAPGTTAEINTTKEGMQITDIYVDGETISLEEKVSSSIQFIGDYLVTNMLYIKNLSGNFIPAAVYTNATYTSVQQ